jgi:shikimate dehydrogenase
MHEAAFRALGLPHRYVACRVRPRQLAPALEGARALGFSGLNVTVPHKQAVCSLLDELHPLAARIGAVNTIRIEGDRLCGHNTDVGGFVRALGEAGSAPAGPAVVLGTGGAARAVIEGLRVLGRDIVCVGRKATVVGGAGLHVVDYGGVNDALAGAGILVNATSVGMKGGPTAFAVEIPLKGLEPDAIVVDLVYPRPAAGLLAAAEEAGHRTLDGLSMLLWQGVEALEIWLQQTLEDQVIDAMRRALGSS